MKSNIKYRVLGVMSGTSLDGIDLAICNFTKKKHWKFKIEKATTISYSKYWKKILQDLHLKDNKTIKKIHAIGKKPRTLISSKTKRKPINTIPIFNKMLAAKSIPSTMIDDMEN